MMPKNIYNGFQGMVWLLATLKGGSQIISKMYSNNFSEIREIHRYPTEIGTIL